MGYIASYYYDSKSNRPIHIIRSELAYRDENEYQILLYYSQKPPVLKLENLAKILEFVEREHIIKSFKDLGMKKIPNINFIEHSYYQIDLDEIENIPKETSKRDEIIAQVLEDKLRFELIKGFGVELQSELSKRFHWKCEFDPL